MLGQEEKDKRIEKARIGRAKLKQPRDWKELWMDYLGHVIQGGIAGALAMSSVFHASLTLAVYAFTITNLFVAYQGLSFARKHDTVGRDLADFGVGWVIGSVVALFYNWVW